MRRMLGFPFCCVALHCWVKLLPNLVLKQCFGRSIAECFASPVPNLLSSWNHNKWKLDESQLKEAFVNFLLTAAAVTVKRSGGYSLS